MYICYLPHTFAPLQGSPCTSHFPTSCQAGWACWSVRQQQQSTPAWRPWQQQWCRSMLQRCSSWGCRYHCTSQVGCSDIACQAACWKLLQSCAASIASRMQELYVAVLQRMASKCGVLWFTCFQGCCSTACAYCSAHMLLLQPSDCCITAVETCTMPSPTCCFITFALLTAAALLWPCVGMSAAAWQAMTAHCSVQLPLRSTPCSHSSPGRSTACAEQHS